MERGFRIALVLLLAFWIQHLVTGQLPGGKGWGGAGKGAGKGAGPLGGQPAKPNVNPNKKWAKTTKSSTTSSTHAKLGDPSQTVNWFNKEREKSMPGSCPVVVDEKLNTDAKKCADYYAKKQKMDNSCPYKGDAGEMSFGSKEPFDMKKMSRSSSSASSDPKDFDYGKPTMAKDSPNQGAWSNCCKMGFGQATKKGFTAAVSLVTLDETRTPSTTARSNLLADLIIAAAKKAQEAEEAQ